MNPKNDFRPEFPDCKTLPVTGERFLPDQMVGDIELEHLHRYAIALNFATGKVVLDIASGEGYGSNLLASVAASVIGVDISVDAVSHATNRYIKPNLEFRLGSCDSIPLADNSVDLVVSFETLEHHNQHDEMLAEMKRVLKKNGILIISTPDKYEYSDRAETKNPYHVKELYFDDFSKLLSSQFTYQTMLGQRIYHGSIVAPLVSDIKQFSTISGEINSIKSTPGMLNTMYYIAVASDIEQHINSLSILDGTKDFFDSFKNTLSELAETRAILQHAQDELLRIKKTFSWNITKPLRALWNIPQIIFSKIF